VSYTYDPNGNLATKTEGSDSWTYSWNAENQLTKVEKNGSEVARFSYDAMGRRVEKVAGGAGGVTTSYTYDGVDILRETGAGTAVRYVHGPGFDEPLAIVDGSALSYLHADGLGTVVKRTDASGAITVARQYDAWGNPEAESAPGYSFTGREWDPEVGLYYYRSRNYSAEVGRFISEDPAGLVAGLNRYAYVHSNPTSAVDPTGKFCIPCLIFIGVLGGVLATSPANAPGREDPTWPSDNGGATIAGAMGAVGAAMTAAAAANRAKPPGGDGSGGGDTKPPGGDGSTWTDVPRFNHCVECEQECECSNDKSLCRYYFVQCVVWYDKWITFPGGCTVEPDTVH
jgi:RHS repeat-associated protein